MEQIISVSEITQEILLNLDYDSIINFCRVNKQAINFCNDPYFWLSKAKQDFNVTPDFFKSTNLSPSQRYLQILTENGGIASGSIRFLSIEQFTLRAIKKGRLDLYNQGLVDGFESLLDLPNNVLDKIRINSIVVADERVVGSFYQMNLALEAFASVKNRKMVKRMLENVYDGESCIFALRGSLESGDLPFVKYVLSFIPKDYNIDWSDFMPYASYSRDVFDFILDKSTDTINFGPCIANALSIGNKELANYIFQVSNNPMVYRENSYIILSGAIKYGSLDFFKQILTLYQGVQVDFTDLLIDAATLNNYDIVDYIFSLNPNISIDISYVVSSNQKDMIDHLFTHISKYVVDWDQVIYMTKTDYMLKYIVSIIPPEIKPNWNKIIVNLTYSGRINYINNIMAIAKKDITNWNNLILSLFNKRNMTIKVIRIIMKYAPKDYKWNFNNLVVPNGERNDHVIRFLMSFA